MMPIGPAIRQRRGATRSDIDGEIRRDRSRVDEHSAGVAEDTGFPLSGVEIRSQMLFNFVGGVITAVEEDYVDVGFRGDVIIDRLMHATANIDEMEGACD